MFEVYTFSHNGKRWCLEAKFLTFDDAYDYAREIHSQEEHAPDTGVCILYDKHWIMSVEEDY